MDKKDLISLSPIRYFDVTNASLKDGEMGLVTAKKGLGKTSILVQFGIDALLQDKALVHVSFDQKSSNVIAWYSSVMAEIAKKKSVNLEEVSEEIYRNRTILNFNQETFTLPKVVSTLKSLNDGGIQIGAIVVDGLDLASISNEDLTCFAEYVKTEKMIAWFSYTSEADNLSDTIEAGKADAFTTVAHLASDGKGLVLSLLKNGCGKVNLDTKTLLMCK